MHLVRPGDWLNAWIYVSDIYLGGYLSHADFSRRSRRLDPDNPLIYSEQPSEKARTISVKELCPVGEYLASIAAAERSEKTSTDAAI